MIIDSLKYASLYYGVTDRLATALKFLQQTDLVQLPEGRHEIDGDNIFAMASRYQTKAEPGVFEAHRKYIDVQCIVEGAERMGYANLDQLKVTKEYEEASDYLLLDGEGDSVVVRAGMFAIFAPQDAHMPTRAAKGPEPVKKVIVKVLA